MIPMLGLLIVVTLVKVKQRLLPNTAVKRSYIVSILVRIMVLGHIRSIVNILYPNNFRNSISTEAE